MANLYQIIDWQDCFESNKTRANDNQRQCLIPNKQNGDGYTQLLEMPNGEALYGAFHATILYLSKQASPRGGYMTHDGTKDGQALTPLALSKEIKFSEATVKTMLETVAKDIGWIVNHSSPGKLEMVAYPRKRVDLKFIIMAQDFHKIQFKNYPTEKSLQKSSRAKSDLRAARELELLHLDSEAPWEIKRIQAVLDWIPGHEYWGRLTVNLLSISRLSRSNSRMKIENAETQMKSAQFHTLITMDQMQAEIKETKASALDYEEVINNRTQDSLWRRKT